MPKGYGIARRYERFDEGLMFKEYTHELHREVRSVSGGYTLEREEAMEVGGKEVLYVVGNACVDSSCCGYWECHYALVPGYVVRWKYKENGEGIPVSVVETITDEHAKEELTTLLEKKEKVSQVQFW